MDVPLFYLINTRWTSPLLDWAMAVASSASLWVPLLVVVVVVLVVRGGFRERALVVCIAVALGIGDGVVVQFMKDGIGRPRPHKTLSGVRMVDLERTEPKFLALARPPRVRYFTADGNPSGGRSFPSGHAVNNFAVATVFALFYRFGWLAYLSASLVAYSRIYNGSHWPSDVMVSVFLGAGVALASVGLVSWIWRVMGGRLMPRTHGRHPELVARLAGGGSTGAGA